MELAEKVRPVHTAFLAVDMQRDYFCAGGIVDLMGHDYRPMEAIVPAFRRFLDEARRARVAVIFTRQTLSPFLRSEAVIEHYARAGMSRPFDPAREDFFGVEPIEGDIVLPKHKYSAFIGTSLDGILRANGIKTLIVGGVATNVCVETTVRDAFMMDYHVVVPADLTAGVDETFREMSLRNIDTFFGEVVRSEEIMTAWRT